MINSIIFADIYNNLIISVFSVQYSVVYVFKWDELRNKLGLELFYISKKIHFS